VLVWLMFPRAKAALNARHAACLPMPAGRGMRCADGIKVVWCCLRSRRCCN
jgi:hypothetical protein